MENKNEKPTVTRAEKTDLAKKLVRSLLEKSSFKSNDLIEEGAKLYAQKFASEDTPNSVKGRIGSVIDVMKKDGEIVFEGGMYALKSEKPVLVETENVQEKQEEKPKKTAKPRAKKVTEEKTGNKVEEDNKKLAPAEEKPKKKRVSKKAKAEEEKIAQTEEKADENSEKNKPLPASPLQPIAPVVPVTPESSPEPLPMETTEEKPKKRGRKPKAEKVEKIDKVEKVETVETPVERVVIEEKPLEQTEEKAGKKAEEKQADKKESVVDMSFLLGDIKSARKELPKREEPKQLPQKAESLAQKTAQPQAQQQAQTQQVKETNVVEKTVKTIKTVKKPERMTVKKPTRPMTADEKLQEAFLKKLRKLGGDYFEYYSVYLLERYSRLNGRRLEMLKVTGGERDGGIDGEIEVTDRLGFRETIYIQAKNWDPDKGDERLWVVGETLLQQFIGACVCRQAKDGKQHCRGIFITTSRFTAEAKKILSDTSDKFVGYDGSDLYEAAKECQFGLVKKNGEWSLDEDLLSGEKAFFRTY